MSTHDGPGSRRPTTIEETAGTPHKEAQGARNERPETTRAALSAVPSSGRQRTSHHAYVDCVRGSAAERSDHVLAPSTQARKGPGCLRTIPAPDWLPTHATLSRGPRTLPARSRGANRPPRTVLVRSWCYSADIRPLGRRSAGHDLHERTSPYFGNPHRSCQPSPDLRRHVFPQVRTARRRAKKPGKIWSSPACRATTRRESASRGRCGGVSGRRDGSRSRSRARWWSGSTHWPRSGSGRAAARARREWWCGP